MRIRIPKEGSFYVGWSTIFGPFHDSGDPWEVVDIGEELKDLQQGPSLYGENSVLHRAADATITINSVLQTPGVRPWSQTNWQQGTHIIPLVYNGRPAEGLAFPACMAGGTHILQASPSGSYHYGQKFVTTDNAVYRFQFNTGKSGSYPRNITFGGAAFFVYPLMEGGQPSALRYSHEVRNCESWVENVKSLDEAYAILSGLTAGSFKPVDKEVSRTSLPKYLPAEAYTANVDKALSWYRKFTNELVHSKPTLPDIQSYGDLVQVACENVNPNTINAIAFIRDLKDIKTLVPKLKELQKVSTHASNYLGVEYGILPTIDDLKTIWDSFTTKYYYDRNGFQRVSAYDVANKLDSSTVSGVQVTTRQVHDRRVHLAIDTNDTGLDALTERMRKLGVFPSLTNLWDLIPLSFVLDWFIDVGAVLERLDTHHQLHNLVIKYTILSDKHQTFTSAVSLTDGIFLDMESKSYRRTVSTNVPQPKIFKENRVTAQNHWVEGSALILARTQK